MSHDAAPTVRGTDVQQPDVLPPAVTAADAGPSAWTRVLYDDGIADMFVEWAKDRAPPTDQQAVWNHLVGFAGEVAVATWTHGEIDRQIYDDFSGDTGVDVTAPSRHRDQADRYQVKTTGNVDTPERIVSPKELNAADYFVLCTTTAPRRHVDIVGVVDRDVLEAYGTAYGRSGYLLHTELLRPVTGELLTPDDVRNAVSR